MDQWWEKRYRCNVVELEGTAEDDIRSNQLGPSSLFISLAYLLFMTLLSFQIFSAKHLWMNDPNIIS